MNNKTSTKTKNVKNISKKEKNRLKKPKALVMLSGGLDSRLVVKILQRELGTENVEAAFFILPFGGGCCSDRFCVLRFCQTELVKLHQVDFSTGKRFDRFMKIVKNPKHHRGTAMNPCFDCHSFMLKEAKKIAKRIGADFIATGEVLGQRPMSQKRPEMNLIEKEAGMKGKVLRPLSAKLLDETEAEKNGLVNRKKLYGFMGRQRKDQMALAKKFKISYPMPAGGCLLTDKVISRRLKLFFDLFGRISPKETILLKTGRHFRIGKSIIIVGRDHDENEMLSAIAKGMKPRPALLECSDEMGPTAMVISPDDISVRKAASLTVRYANLSSKKNVKVLIKYGKDEKIINSSAMSQSIIKNMMV